MKADVVVVGGGHAGIEAANVAARMGVSTLLVCSHVDMIGQMSCNPAIGGIAKGTIVREVDALGGIMGQATDRAGIHFRMLNRSKGPAVWGNRAQADKALYRKVVRSLLEREAYLSLLQDTVVGVAERNGKVWGVHCLSGETIEAQAVVLAMGTFLNGLAHVGHTSFVCGRSGEPASIGLSESIQALGITVGRLKTGTPARIDGRTVDTSRMIPQPGDAEPWPFSFCSDVQPQNKVMCWATRTTQATHELIRENLDSSALYGGKIKGIGPRYCPSIEDKIVRFGDRDGHTLFLEPEGTDHHEMYLSGLSTSLPLDTQRRMVQTIPGLEKTRIIRPAYAIEYDYFRPVQLRPSLESKVVGNLFFAGQINGTSGYEEAACQGLVAGVNAAEAVLGGEPLVLGRGISYIGVLIDDLVTKGTEEPYRMFTSRAEYRLMLRQDNADERLMAIARDRGTVDEAIFSARQRVWDERDRLVEFLREADADLGDGESLRGESPSARRGKALDLLRRPDVNLDEVLRSAGVAWPGRDVALRAEADIKYEGFVRKQRASVDRQMAMESAPIPAGLDYDSIPGLLSESRAKLGKIRPATIGQASRISGVTPADVSILVVHLFRNDR